MDNMFGGAKEISLDELDKITGGEYDPDVAYKTGLVVIAGDYYDTSDMTTSRGKLSLNSTVEVHPEFEYYLDGKCFIIVRIGGKDYVTERVNISIN